MGSDTIDLLNGIGEGPSQIELDDTADSGIDDFLKVENPEDVFIPPKHPYSDEERCVSYRIGPAREKKKAVAPAEETEEQAAADESTMTPLELSKKAERAQKRHDYKRQSGDGGKFSLVTNPTDEHSGHVAAPEVISLIRGKGEYMGFRATPDQLKFREMAMRMAKKGRYFRAEWFEETRRTVYPGAEVSESVWQRWIEFNSKFLAWFFDEFPMAQEINDTELKMMDIRFWHGIRDAMESGEEWAYRQYSRVRFERSGGKKSQGSPAELDELRRYFKSGGGDRWKNQSSGG